MTYDDNKLIQLQQKSINKNQLEAKLRELQEQKRVYDRDHISLQVAYEKEQEDVKKLKGRSLANYFYHVVGSMDNKLDKEKTEAYAAKVKLDTIEQQLMDIERDIERIYAQLSEIREAESQYKAVLEEKYVQLRLSGTESAKEIIEIENKIGLIEAQIIRKMTFSCIGDEVYDEVYIERVEASAASY